jgi:hypothetical protein
VSGVRRLFAYTAADAFYYLHVGWIWSRTGSFSFDGERPTNGFHPLWQFIVALAHRGSDALGLSPTAMVAFVVAAGVVLIVIALLALARALRLAYGHVPSVFALLPVGMYALTLLPFWLAYSSESERANPWEGDVPLYGTLWSYVNGMETPLVLACFAALVLVAVREGFVGRRAAIALGVASSLLVLARLDEAFIVAGLFMVLAALAALRRDAPLMRSVVMAGAIVAVVVAVYVVWNRLYADVWLPVSGTEKTTFPDPQLVNLRDFRALLGGEHAFARASIYRLWPMVLPPIVAGLWLLVGAARGSWLQVVRGDLSAPCVRYRVALAGTAVGVVVSSAWSLLFVPAAEQGHWYHSIASLFVTLVVIDVVARRSRVRDAAQRHRGVVLGGAAVLAAVVFLGVGRTNDYHERFADFFYDGAPAVRAFYDGHPPAMFSYDDGIDVYALRTPGLSATGLMLDAGATDAEARDRLLPLAYARCIDHFSSVQYFDATGLTTRSTSPEVRQRLERLLAGEPLDDFDFAVEFALPADALSTPREGATGEFVVVRFWPRDAADPGPPRPADELERPSWCR